MGVGLVVAVAVAVAVIVAVAVGALVLVEVDVAVAEAGARVGAPVVGEPDALSSVEAARVGGAEVGPEDTGALEGDADGEAAVAVKVPLELGVVVALAEVAATPGTLVDDTPGVALLEAATTGSASATGTAAVGRSRFAKTANVVSHVHTRETPDLPCEWRASAS